MRLENAGLSNAEDDCFSPFHIPAIKNGAGDSIEANPGGSKMASCFQPPLSRGAFTSDDSDERPPFKLIVGACKELRGRLMSGIFARAFFGSGSSLPFRPAELVHES